MRPGVAPEARPEQDEPNGPLGGLVGAASTQAATEAVPSAADAAVLEKMGVEGEGIESGQILGLVVATILSVIALAFVLIYLFIIPTQQQDEEEAGNIQQYPELQQSRTDALAKISQYGRADSVYTLPIERAMSLTAARYQAAQGATPGGLPSNPQEFNTLMLNRGTGTAVQNPAGLPRRTTVEQERLSAESEGEAGAARTATPSTATPAATAPGRTNEEVGVDDNRRDTPPATLGDVQSE